MFGWQDRMREAVTGTFLKKELLSLILRFFKNTKLASEII